jgi:hypothetical protein
MAAAEVAVIANDIKSERASSLNHSQYDTDTIPVGFIAALASSGKPRSAARG